MTTRRYPVVIEPTCTGYSAYSPDVAGCEVDELIPKPRTSFDYVEVAACARISGILCGGLDPELPQMYLRGRAASSKLYSRNILQSIAG
jgi:hypothetical protein